MQLEFGRYFAYRSVSSPTEIKFNVVLHIKSYRQSFNWSKKFSTACILIYFS
jgi:hypothetical protein